MLRIIQNSSAAGAKSYSDIPALLVTIMSMFTIVEMIVLRSSQFR